MKDEKTIRARLQAIEQANELLTSTSTPLEWQYWMAALNWVLENRD